MLHLKWTNNVKFKNCKVVKQWIMIKKENNNNNIMMLYKNNNNNHNINKEQ